MRCGKLGTNTPWQPIQRHTDTDRARRFRVLAPPQVDESGGLADEGELNAEEIADVDEIAAQLERLVRANVTFVVKPVMSPAAVKELVEARGMLGKNPGKNGALMQDGKTGAYTELSMRDTPLGQFLCAVDGTVGQQAEICNTFARLQEGTVRLRSGPNGRWGPDGGGS